MASEIVCRQVSSRTSCHVLVLVLVLVLSRAVVTVLVVAAVVDLPVHSSICPSTCSCVSHVLKLSSGTTQKVYSNALHPPALRYLIDTNRPEPDVMWHDMSGESFPARDGVYRDAPADRPALRGGGIPSIQAPTQREDPLAGKGRDVRFLSFSGGRGGAGEKLGGESGEKLSQVFCGPLPRFGRIGLFSFFG